MIQDRSVVNPGRVRLEMASKNNYYSVFREMGQLATNVPLTAQLIPNGITSPLGQCANVTFPGVPPCVYTPVIPPRNDKLNCK